MSMRVVCLSIVAGFAGVSAYGQDTRTVTEPVFPAVCSTLSATQSIVSGEPSGETLTNTQPDTARIQSALNAIVGSCGNGKALELAASGGNNAFLAGPLTIPSNVTLIIDGGVTLFASRNPADYQAGTVGSSYDQCGTDGSLGNGCKALIATSPSTSTNIAVMGYGVINGRGQDKLIVGGALSSQSWYDIADGKGSGSQNNPVLVAANKSSNFILYKISLINAPTFHVTEKNSTGFTAWGVKIATPWSVFNTDGLQTGQITNVTATNNWISDGDDDFVTTATTSTSSANLTVMNTQVGSGHGVSISAGGGPVSNMFVSNVNFSGQTADTNQEAIHLKGDMANGGVYTNVTYQNICIRNVHHPLRLDPFYATTAGTNYPQFKNIVLNNVHVLTEGQVGLQGYSSAYPTSLTLNEVVFDVLKWADITPAASNISIALGPGEVYPTLLQSLTGTGVAYTGSAPATNTNAYDCTTAFPLIQGELYATTAASTVGYPAAATVTNPTSFNLNAVVEPLNATTSYLGYTAAPLPTAAINFYEGATLVGTGTLGSNGTLTSAAITNAMAGTHTYTAAYAGDTNYPAFTFGSVTVTVAAGPATQLVYTAAPAASVQYGTSSGMVSVSIEDGAGDVINSSANVQLTVSGANGSSMNQTVAANKGVATFAVGVLPGVSSYTFTAASAGLTSASAGQSVTQAPLTLTAQAASRVFDAISPGYTFATSGYVNGDTSAVLTGAPSFSTSALRNSDAGAYGLQITTGSLAAANYMFTTLQPSTLTVTGNAPQQVTFDPLPNLPAGTYQLTASATSGLPVGYTVQGNASVSGSTLIVSGSGNITVTATAAGNADYAASPAVTVSFVAP